MVVQLRQDTVNPVTDYSVNIDASNAAALLIDESHKRPVVADFWSDRSAPCKVLTPLLEKIASEYQGAFLLAKVNADQQPGIAQQLGVRNLPTVMVTARPMSNWLASVSV